MGGGARGDQLITGRPAGLSRPGVLRDVLTMAGAGVAYYLAARLSLHIALIQKNVTPLWPPTGIALVAFLVFGRRVWPGVAIAAFLVNLPISTNALAAAATAAGNTLAPVFAATLLRGVHFRWQLDRLRDAIAIVFLGALLSMAVSASIGAGTLVLSNAIPAHRFLSAWAVWWTGDAMGVLVVAPFLLSLGLMSRRRPRPPVDRLEALTLYMVLGTVTVWVMNSHLSLLFLVFPFLGWAAWRFQVRGAAPASLLVAGLASWSAAHGLGPFDHGSLFQRMLTLQAFNASVAFSSLFFAALVTERRRAGRALERAAADLEHRVAERTAQLSTANEQLAAAQHLAHLGSWEWLVPEDRVSWSDEMYRIYGYGPQQFPVTFEKAIERVLPEDAERIRETVRRVLGEGRDRPLPDNEYRIVREDGTERILLGKARLMVDPQGAPHRMVGTVQDITETRRAQREHRIAETLQRNLLPDRLPEIPGVSLAARYVAASGDARVGGDWYDVVQLPNGHVALAIGDVAGHGLRAASIMGQLRMALRAYVLEDESPASVVGRVHQLVQRLDQPEIVTVAYLVFDPDTGILRFAIAGHPPPLVAGPDGEARFLEGALAPPIGALAYLDRFVEDATELPPDSTLLLFTDGLVERRGASIHDGMARLKGATVDGLDDLEALCDRVLHTVADPEGNDDIALLALRPVPLAQGPLRIRGPAEPRMLAPIRQTLRRWLREIHADAEDANAILVACGEACANAVQHAYGAQEGFLEVGAELVDGDAAITVRDEGAWRLSFPTEDGGRGIELMRGFMDAVEITRGPAGTEVRMRRRIEARTGSEHAGTS